MLKRSFLPLVNASTKTLILGSLPGDKSLELNEYYAHPQNRFWKVIRHLYNSPDATNYVDKINLLVDNGIGLWDVCAEASRPGSMDLAIKDESPNPIIALLEANPAIKLVVFNGQKAHNLYLKYFKKKENITYICLPSTSPANAKTNLEKLIVHWRAIISD
ncbi:MAG: DNA-deoxyinosine glycosylase [Sphingobacterium sp.]